MEEAFRLAYGLYRRASYTEAASEYRDALERYPVALSAQYDGLMAVALERAREHGTDLPRSTGKNDLHFLSRSFNHSISS